MQRARTVSIERLVRAFAIVAAISTAMAADASGRVRAEESPAYIVEVPDVTAKVGEHEVMLARLRVREGYRILRSYNNRVMALSSWDDGVAFDGKVVRATVQDDALVFAVGLRATKPGKHPINGIFRVGYIQDDSGFGMVSIRLVANVTGTE
jgi:hypothetical protein